MGERERINFLIGWYVGCGNFRCREGIRANVHRIHHHRAAQRAPSPTDVDRPRVTEAMAKHAVGVSVCIQATINRRASLTMTAQKRAN